MASKFSKLNREDKDIFSRIERSIRDGDPISRDFVPVRVARLIAEKHQGDYSGLAIEYSSEGCKLEYIKKYF